MFEGSIPYSSVLTEENYNKLRITDDYGENLTWFPVNVAAKPTCLVAELRRQVQSCEL